MGIAICANGVDGGIFLDSGLPSGRVTKARYHGFGDFDRPYVRSLRDWIDHLFALRAAYPTPHPGPLPGKPGRGSAMKEFGKLWWHV